MVSHPNRSKHRVRIAVDIPLETIANLVCSALESERDSGLADWCTNYTPKPRRDVKLKLGSPWQGYVQDYVLAPLTGVLEIEADDPNAPSGTGRTKTYKLDMGAIRFGLGVIAKQHPLLFGRILKGETDAPDAGNFIQCCIFGEVVYG